MMERVDRDYLDHNPGLGLSNLYSVNFSYISADLIGKLGP